MICGVCMVRSIVCYGCSTQSLTCVKGGELERIKHKLRVFEPGRLLVVRVGNLSELNTS